MKKVSLLFLLIPFLSNAQYRVIPFKNKYQTYPDTIASKYNYDQTWSMFIQFMQKNNFTGKLLDKNTGIITLQLDNGKITAEDKKGNIDTSAWAISERVYSVARNKYYYLKQSPIIWFISIQKTNDNDEIVLDSMQVVEGVKIFTHNLMFGEDYSKEYKTGFATTGKLEDMIKQCIE